jgi:hypothetical protein
MLYELVVLHTLGWPPQLWAVICLPKAILHCQVNFEVVLLLACYLLSGFLAYHHLPLQL